MLITSLTRLSDLISVRYSWMELPLNSSVILWLSRDSWRATLGEVPKKQYPPEMASRTRPSQVGIML